MPTPHVALALRPLPLAPPSLSSWVCFRKLLTTSACRFRAAGLLVSGYALGVAVGAPLLAALTVRLRRKTALLGLMGLLILGNVLYAIAPDYTFLMTARLITAFCHGASRHSDVPALLNNPP